jgi:phosphatidylinositol-3-phosphatase
LSITAPGLFCCNEQPGPNLAAFPQTTNITSTISLTFQGYGGDRTGAVLLSPFLKPGTVSNTPFNQDLGYAGQPGLVGFFGCVTSDIAAKDYDQFPHCENR